MRRQVIFAGVLEHFVGPSLEQDCTMRDRHARHQQSQCCRKGGQLVGLDAHLCLAPDRGQGITTSLLLANSWLLHMGSTMHHMAHTCMATETLTSRVSWPKPLPASCSCWAPAMGVTCKPASCLHVSSWGQDRVCWCQCKLPSWGWARQGSWTPLLPVMFGVRTGSGVKRQTPLPQTLWAELCVTTTCMEARGQS